MDNSHSKKPSAPGVKPRKMPSQGRSSRTVETILEGAAHVLEQNGLEGYTTNAIAARAGVSIGSLYQYFPTKDAVTAALIEQDLAGVVEVTTAALQQDDPRLALRALIDIGVRHQMRRPKLARLLDFEQSRLAALMPASDNVVKMREAIASLVLRYCSSVPHPDPQLAAVDIITMIGALTDAAGSRQIENTTVLADRIEGAVAGYLSVIEQPDQPPASSH